MTLPQKRRKRYPRQRRAPRIAPEIAGTVKMSTEECRKFLGHGAFLLWLKLLHCRDREGWTHVTYPTLVEFHVLNREGNWVGFERQTLKQIEKAFQRLKRAGVVRNVRWFKTCAAAKPVMQRVVHGCWSVGRRLGWTPTFPGEVWRGIKSLPTRGGARPGAGRPHTKPGPEQPRISRSCRTRSEFKTGDIGTPNSNGGDNKIDPIIGVHRSNSFPSEKNGGETPRSEILSTTPFLDTMSNEGPASPQPSTTEPSNGDGSDGRGSPPPRSVPTYPSSDLIMPAMTPGPPQLDPNAIEVEWADRLAQAYRGAAEALTGKRCWVFTRGDITRSKHYARLVAAARALIEHEIPPAAWASFSFDVWRDYTRSDKKKPPPVTWVFAEGRIHKNRGWFRSDGAGSGMGGRAIFGETHRALLAQYAQMRWELRVTADEDVSGVVERFFPGDTYERMVEASLREAEDIQTSLRHRATSGQYLWG